MKKFAIAGAAAALFAIPAAANAQAWVQAESGLDVVTAGGESLESVSYGVSAGYDVPLSGNMFVGIQGTFAESEMKDCLIDVEADEEDCLKAGRDLSAVARFGTNVGEKAKLYVLGGYTNARFIETFAEEDIIKANLDGFRLGAGAQYALNSQVFVKGEYRYSNYEGDVSRHNVLVGLGVEF